MNMDRLLHSLQLFSEDLESFTRTISDAAAALEKEHQALSDWNDPFSDGYWREWEEFEGHLDRILEEDAPWYRAFLDSRMDRIGRYLYG